MAKREVSLIGMKEYIDNGAFNSQMTRVIKALSPEFNKVLKGSLHSRGKSGAIYFHNYASGILLKTFSNLSLKQKKKTSKTELFLNDGNKQYLIRFHFSDNCVGSPNVGSPNEVIGNMDTGFCDDYFHIFMNGFENDKILECAGTTLTALAKSGLIRYPNSLTSNQYQLIKSKDIDNVRKVKAQVSKNKVNMLLGLLPDRKVLEIRENMGI